MTQQVAFDRNRTYTPPEVAKILGCSPKVVRRLLKDGDLSGVPMNKDAKKLHMLIPGAAVANYLKDNKTTKPQGKSTEVPDIGDVYNTIEDLRNDMNTGDAVLNVRLDAIEARLNKAVYDLWMSHVNTLDALSDRFIPNVNSLANGLRVGAELDAKNAGFALPCKEDRRKLTESKKN